MATGRQLLISSAVLLGLGGLGAALANEPSIPSTTRAFKSLDENADGKIELTEIQPRAVKRFQRFDGNGDGEVTAGEITENLQKRAERRKAGIMTRMDADSDGTITRGELDKYIAQRKQPVYIGFCGRPSPILPDSSPKNPHALGGVIG